MKAKSFFNIFSRNPRLDHYQAIWKICCCIGPVHPFCWWRFGDLVLCRARNCHLLGLFQFWRCTRNLEKNYLWVERSIFSNLPMQNPNNYHFYVWNLPLIFYHKICMICRHPSYVSWLSNLSFRWRGRIVFFHYFNFEKSFFIYI